MTENKKTEYFAKIINDRPGKGFALVIICASALAAAGFTALLYTLFEGLGVWGINSSVPWGMDITNFVFWIGVGHAGTLISAILYLFGASWRGPLNRSAELMTLVALICAIVFPLIHTGRPYLALYRLLPYPNQMSLLPNFASPLVWDVFAIGSYFIVSVMFWYLGLIPDFAKLKNKLNSPVKRRLFELLSIGYSDSNLERARHAAVYTVLAGLATALVVSVHSVVSFDFSVTGVPGWKSEIFPVYFVAGAIYSGCAMVAGLIVILRKAYKLDDFISENCFDNLLKTTLASALILTLCFLGDLYGVYRSSHEADLNSFLARISGSNAVGFTLTIGLAFIVPHVFWFKKVRVTPAIILTTSVLINVGMWCERYSLIVPALETSQLAGGATFYYPTITEIAIFAGTLGLFAALITAAFRFVPVLTLWEKE